MQAHGSRCISSEGVGFFVSVQFYNQLQCWFPGENN